MVSNRLPSSTILNQVLSASLSFSTTHQLVRHIFPSPPIRMFVTFFCPALLPVAVFGIARLAFAFVSAFLAFSFRFSLSCAFVQRIDVHRIIFLCAFLAFAHLNRLLRAVVGKESVVQLWKPSFSLANITVSSRLFGISRNIAATRLSSDAWQGRPLRSVNISY